MCLRSIWEAKYKLKIQASCAENGVSGLLGGGPRTDFCLWNSTSLSHGSLDLRASRSACRLAFAFLSGGQRVANELERGAYFTITAGSVTRAACSVVL